MNPTYIPMTLYSMFREKYTRATKGGWFLHGAWLAIGDNEPIYSTDDGISERIHFSTSQREDCAPHFDITES